MYNFITVSYDSVIDNLIGEVNFTDSFREAENLTLTQIEKLNLPNEIFLNVQFSKLGRVVSKIAIRKFEILTAKMV